MICFSASPYPSPSERHRASGIQVHRLGRLASQYISGDRRIHCGRGWRPNNPRRPSAVRQWYPPWRDRSERAHVSSEQGVGQQIRNQKAGEGVPALFYSAQLLLAANSFDPRYGTVGTPRKLWSVWKEREDSAEFAAQVVNRVLDGPEAKRVAQDFAPYMKRHNGLMEDHRLVTPLDETLVGLCRPERFMRLVRRYMLFDGPHKKVARYQQVATIETLLKRIEERGAGGKRMAAWSGILKALARALTMVMLAKAIVMTNPQSRIVIVTDRTDLDDQISKTFRATGQEPKRAATGENLLSLIEDKTPW